MTIHIHWQSSSPVLSLRSVAAKEGNGNTVYLTAGKFAQAGSMSKLIQVLQRAGYEDLFPDLQDGLPCLTIRKVEDAESIAELLEHSSWAEGTRQAVEIPDPPVISPSFIRQYAVKGVAAALAGVGIRGLPALLQGDRSYLTGSAISMGQQTIQLAYGTGTGTTAEEMMAETRQRLSAEGTVLPLLQQENAPSPLHRLKRLLERYPVPISYSLGIAMGAAWLRSGIMMKNPSVSYGGASLIVGASAVTFVPEIRMTSEEQEASLTKDLRDDLRAIPGAIVNTITHPLQAPGHLWHYIRKSPKGFAATLSIPVYITSWFDAAYQTHNVRVRWPAENPEKIQLLEKQIAGLHALPAAAQLTQAKHLGKLESNLKMLTRQLELSHGMGRQIIPAAMYSSRIASTVILILQNLATKNRLSQQTDMTKFDKFYSLAAQTLLKVPESERQQAIDQAIDFLSQQPDILDAHISLAMLKYEITSRMQTFHTNNPWIGKSPSIARSESKNMDRVNSL